jgi:hypothetical protein
MVLSRLVGIARYFPNGGIASLATPPIFRSAAAGTVTAIKSAGDLRQVPKKG